MKGYSQDLRERIIRSWENGHKPEWIAEEYKIGYSTVKRYITRFKRLGHVRATEQGYKQSRFTVEDIRQLEAQVSLHSDASVDDHVALWNETQALQVSRSGMGRALQKLGWTLKKRPSAR